MHPIDWLIVGAYLAWLIRDGLRRTHSTDEIEGYLLAKRSLPWWAAGLSVMATQLSAITLVGTTGQGYSDGMRFVQFYFGLPIAMVILSLTVVPFFYRARVYTAYEFLERRFDAKVRGLATVLFLAGRSMSSGVVIAAPAVILSVVLGWNLSLTVLAIGVPTVLYTMFGGVQAVAWTDVKQMAVIVAGVAAAVIALVLGLPAEVGLADSLHLAGAVGPPEDARLLVQPHRAVHRVVGNAGGPLPDAVVLRMRPEPGAALPHGEVRRREPAVAADERLFQDSPAGRHPADRRPGLRLLRLHAPADAVQPGPPGDRRGEQPRGRLQGPRPAVRIGLRGAAPGRARLRRGERPR